MPTLPLKPSGEGDIGNQNLNFGPLLSETGKLCLLFWHLWKALGQDYKPTKFGGPKFKNKSFAPN